MIVLKRIIQRHHRARVHLGEQVSLRLDVIDLPAPNHFRLFQLLHRENLPRALLSHQSHLPCSRFRSESRARSSVPPPGIFPRASSLASSPRLASSRTESPSPDQLERFKILDAHLLPPPPSRPVLALDRRRPIPRARRVPIARLRALALALAFARRAARLARRPRLARHLRHRPREPRVLPHRAIESRPVAIESRSRVLARLRPSSRAKSQISNPRDDAESNRIESLDRRARRPRVRDPRSRFALRARDARAIDRDSRAIDARDSRARIRASEAPAASTGSGARLRRPIGRADATFVSHGFRARARDAMVLKDARYVFRRRIMTRQSRGDSLHPRDVRFSFPARTRKTRVARYAARASAMARSER